MARSEVIVPLTSLGQGTAKGVSAPRDTLARPLRDLRISVMDRCNFRCPYCMPRETFHEKYKFLGSHERLSFDEIGQIGSQQRLAAGQAQLAHPQLREQPTETHDLIEG